MNVNQNSVGSGIDDGENESYHTSVGRALSKPCDTCRWWNNEKPTVCEAFPSGIPLPIFFGFLDHTTPFGNEDLLYEKSITKGLTHLLKKKIKKDGGGYKESVEPIDELHPRYPAGTPGGLGGKYMPKGSPEYIAARKQSLERFSAPKYAVGRSATDVTPEEFTKKSKLRRHREALQIAAKVLSPEHLEEFKKALNAVHQDITDGKYSYKDHILLESTPDNRLYTEERKKLHEKIVGDLLAGSENKKPKNGKNPEFIILGGVGGCLYWDHEILTLDGWKYISEYLNEKVLIYDADTGTTFFEHPTNYIISSCDTFYRFKSQHFDLLVSGDHSIPYLSNDGLNIKSASEIYSKYIEDRIGCNLPLPYLKIISEGASPEVYYDVASSITKVVIPESYKYCFTTSTGYFITRRNGLIAITGNSGKSKFSEGSSKVFDEATHVKLDSDEIKSMIPGYTPEKAALFHAEAADILSNALTEAKKRKLNIALDATMSASEKPYIDEIKSRGYDVSVHYMHVSPREAAGRAISRWLNHKSDGTPRTKDMSGKSVRGRLVDPAVLLGMVNNLHNFDEARRRVSNWSFNRNNVPSGADPIRVLSSHI